MKNIPLSGNVDSTKYTMPNDEASEVPAREFRNLKINIFLMFCDTKIYFD
jgi:hypothetical protein